LDEVKRWYWPSSTSGTKYLKDQSGLTDESEADNEREDDPRREVSRGSQEGLVRTHSAPLPHNARSLSGAKARAVAALDQTRALYAEHLDKEKKQKEDEVSLVEKFKTLSLGLLPKSIVKPAEELSEKSKALDGANSESLGKAALALPGQLSIKRSEEEIRKLEDRVERLLATQATGKIETKDRALQLLSDVKSLVGKTPPTGIADNMKKLRRALYVEGVVDYVAIRTTATLLQTQVEQFEKEGENRAYYAERFPESQDWYRELAGVIQARAPVRAKSGSAGRGNPKRCAFPHVSVHRGMFGDPSSEFITGTAMLPVVLQVLEKMKWSFKAWCYTLDHTGVCVMLVRKLLQAAEGERRPCSGRMILDQKNFFDSSCARQAARVEELYQAGCKMRIVKPSSRAGFSSMHSKTWLVDDEVILTGSLNLTHNAFENNTEHLWKMKNPNAVQEK